MRRAECAVWLLGVIIAAAATFLGWTTPAAAAVRPAIEGWIVRPLPAWGHRASVCARLTDSRKAKVRGAKVRFIWNLDGRVERVTATTNGNGIATARSTMLVANIWSPVSVSAIAKVSGRRVRWTSTFVPRPDFYATVAPPATTTLDAVLHAGERAASKGRLALDRANANPSLRRADWGLFLDMLPLLFGGALVVLVTLAIALRSRRRDQAEHFWDG